MSQALTKAVWRAPTKCQKPSRGSRYNWHYLYTLLTAKHQVFKISSKLIRKYNILHIIGFIHKHSNYYSTSTSVHSLYLSIYQWTSGRHLRVHTNNVLIHTHTVQLSGHSSMLTDTDHHCSYTKRILSYNVHAIKHINIHSKLHQICTT